ncbi:acetate/propionate family kinase [Dyella solisilvae]|uniref:Acetate kinase n=1 Tax=Dyella solisilvae TaxID=1920168 RepID=A0A370K4Y2_9GAMM|nr:acetate/propionate family kinase [Dyella solisilvae]RDI97070.1 acetate/propionate family kinase [Dyella solisilvae]
MIDIILVLNAGSSSIKFRVFEVGAGMKLAMRGQVDGLYTKASFRVVDPQGEVTRTELQPPDGGELGHEGAIAHIGDFLRGHGEGYSVVAVGHRVVHGGQHFTSAVLATPAVVDELDKLSPLAPLHQPHNLAPIRIIHRRRPELPQVACFDTAFHRNQPEVAQAYALPASITDLGVRRYGFHGLSYEYIASVLADYSPVAAAGRTVVAHLGNGASMCAMVGGRSVASTMGFTAVDGLPMGTRCGNLDPGVILYLIDALGMDTRGVADLIYRQSGLLGVSGVSSDMRELLHSDDANARAAVDLFVYRIARELGSLVAAMGGIDALVFTAGIGENASAVRKRVASLVGWCGLDLDDVANEAGGPCISKPGSRVGGWVIPTDEESMIARQTMALMG